MTLTIRKDIRKHLHVAELWRCASPRRSRARQILRRSFCECRCECLCELWFRTSVRRSVSLEYTKNTKYITIIKITKFTKNIKFELWKLYMIQNKNLSLLNFFESFNWIWNPEIQLFVFLFSDRSEYIFKILGLYD